MKVVIHMSKTAREQRFVQVLVEGFKHHNVKVITRLKPPRVETDPTCDLAVFIGVKGSKVRDACVSTGQPYIMIDKGYFSRKRFHRFALNGFTPCYLGSGRSDPGRFEALNINLTNVRRPNANLVLFIGLTAKYARFHKLGNEDEYQQGICGEISRVLVEGGRPDLQVYLRPKTEVRRALAGTPLPELLPKCYCVVTHGSIAGVEAMAAGIPVISLGGIKANVVHDLANPSISDVLAPRIPTREQFYKRMAELAWCQFTTDEVASGFAWDVLKEQYKRL